MPPKRNISFTKPPEPAFIKRMKDSIGYQEPPTIETKKQKLAHEDDDIELEDDKPVVVVLNSENITKDELEAFTENSKNEKVVFSKPAKKNLEEKSSLNCSSKKQLLQKKVDALKDSKKAVKNSSLLSFDEDEDY
ncbi:uncharacterized protein KIAA1143 homolog [Parasteatoda tepidariorum]|uniref:uncharacterized protein KIAA1143 homolog n=1 Tax=Parasteatoda tepidariorum TaxID=114398 RepID=UPI00077FBDF2|nr:uncharacterized protein KIAA1143 homolog [Parasteatoda tepidariorum]